MVWAGYFEKFLEVISQLSCLVLEIALNGYDLLLIGAVRSLVTIVITDRSDCNTLGVPLLPLFVALSAFPSTFAGSFGWCPPAAVGDHFPFTLNEGIPDHFITRSMSGGDVK
jgi:hypothetical protein